MPLDRSDINDIDLAIKIGIADDVSAAGFGLVMCCFK